MVVAGRKRLVAAQTLRLQTIPCLVHDMSEAEADALEAADNLTVAHPIAVESLSPILLAGRRLVAGHLSAIRRSVDMSVDGAVGLNRSTVDLMQAHLWRASRIVGALDLIAKVPSPPTGDRALASIVDEVIDGFAPECRVSGVRLRAETKEHLTSSGLHARDLLAGISGAVLATLPLVEHAVKPTISIETSTAAGSSVAISITQTEAPVAQAAADRFFDAELLHDRQGGTAATIGALAAKALAEHRGGTASFDALDQGSRLTMTLRRRS
jgi:hypothetical protein